MLTEKKTKETKVYIKNKIKDLPSSEDVPHSSCFNEVGFCRDTACIGFFARRFFGFG